MKYGLSPRELCQRMRPAEILEQAIILKHLEQVEQKNLAFEIAKLICGTSETDSESDADSE